jgi:Sulfatase-modifying factor enzyme 1
VEKPFRDCSPSAPVPICEVLSAAIGKGSRDETDERGSRHPAILIEIKLASKQGEGVPVLLHEARNACLDESLEAARPMARRNFARPTHEADAPPVVKADEETARRYAGAQPEVKWRTNQEKGRRQLGVSVRQRAQDDLYIGAPNTKRPECMPWPAAAAAAPNTIGTMNRGRESAWQAPRGALLTVCVFGLILVGSIGVFLADAHRIPVPPEATPVESSPPPVQAPATPAPPASGSAVPLLPAEGFPSGVMPLSPEHERALEPLGSFKECNNCPEMVVVPAGRFTMDSADSEQGHNPDESPRHSVTFARRFAVGRFAVTFDEWDACVTEGGCNGYKPSDQAGAYHAGHRICEEARPFLCILGRNYLMTGVTRSDLRK